MDALAVARLVHAMTLARTPEALSQVFLENIAHAGPLDGACCYRRNATGDRLLPLASAASSDGELPTVDTGELDNPLVYTLGSGQLCHVQDISRLVSVGEDFDALRERWPKAQSLLVLPLRNTRTETIGLIALFAAPVALERLRTDTLWLSLTESYAHLFARVNDMLMTEENVRYERAVRHKQETDHGHHRARRLLASELVGQSAVSRQLREDMLRLADSSLSILITGETGSGKDHAAWLIHQASARGGPFVPINCAAMPKDLIEAELFGSARGAYTGATQARHGLVAEAHGGTLFLDEIGDMPLALQGVLLRVINEKKYRPVGSTKERESDFRLICATHQPLPQRIREGLFREDLYYRIRQRALHVPPLRERPDDIAAIATHLLMQHNRAQQTHVAGFSAEALAWLRAQDFPGNVRELRSLVLAAAEQTGSGQTIGATTLRALKAPLDEPSIRETPRAPDDTPLRDLLSMNSLSEAVDTFEQLMIANRLQQLHGSRSQAAQSLGIPKRTLAYKCQKWNLDRETDSA